MSVVERTTITLYKFHIKNVAKNNAAERWPTTKTLAALQ